jgi:DNA repair exonuclease SbcCD ATPase subunit
MVKCNKCTKDIASTKDGCCMCVTCRAQFHTSCVSETMTRGSQNNWKCEKCSCDPTDPLNKPSSNCDQGNMSVLEAITALRNDMNKRWDTNDKKLDSMQQELNSFISEIKSLNEKVDYVTEKTNRIDDKVQQLTAEKCKLQQELTAAKKEIHDLQKQTRKNNIVISGIPVQPNGTNVFPILKKIAELLKLTYFQTDINAAHWLPARGGEPRSQPIVVSFVSRLVKNEWLLARRHKQTLKAKEIDINFPDAMIFLNEQLTQETRIILNTARAMIKEKKMASVWTNDGHVMVKRCPTSRPFRVKCLQDLHEKTPPATTAPGASADSAQANEARAAAVLPPTPTTTNASV